MLLAPFCSHQAALERDYPLIGLSDFAGPSLEAWVRHLHPPILHLGASADLLGPTETALLKAKLPDTLIMRSVPIHDEASVEIARSYEGIADYLLLDSYRQADRQIGALGVTHDWNISRRIVDAVRIPVFLAGGLGPDNVQEAIRLVRPAGVDSKTKTDQDGSHAKDLGRVRRFRDAARAVASRGIAMFPAERPPGCRSGMNPAPSGPEQCLCASWARN